MPEEAQESAAEATSRELLGLSWRPRSARGPRNRHQAAALVARGDVNTTTFSPTFFEALILIVLAHPEGYSMNELLRAELP